MATIIPRWEWRTFGSAFGGAEAVLAEKIAGAPHESDEVYFLSGSDENVKVRDDLMDLKVLRETRADGLEQWMPVLKASFPLPATETKKILAALHVEAPTARASYTIADFIAEFTGPGRSIRAVKVHKARRRCTIGTCMAELSDVVAEGRATRTIAVESEDPAAVLEVVRQLGLGAYLNTSYPKGLAALLKGALARYAVIDVGTNSVKFHVGERTASGTWTTVVDRSELTRLGEGLDARGGIGSAPLTRTIEAIAGMVGEARSVGALAIAAVGTAGLRMARNGGDIVDAIRRATGITVEVISGQEEGRLAYVAVRAGLAIGKGSIVVFDTGGGSSQFTFGQDSQVTEQWSVDVGAVRYTERFGLNGPVTGDVLARAFAAIAADLSRIEGRPRPDALVAMGGAVTNMAAVKHGLATYDPNVVQGTVIEKAEVDRQIEIYRSRDADGRRTIVGLQPKRADVILAGACIVRTVMDKLGQDRFTVSDRGLRHGVLMERFKATTAPRWARP